MPFIIIVGILLRLSYIIKPEGLWNDEYVSWMVANTPFADGFWTAVIKQCHMPLYYLYLKPFAGFSDLILRLTSVVPGVLAIPVMYFAGKEYSKKTGYIAAAVTSVLSFAVYYSQEVRFYSLLLLLSALLLLFTLRAIKEPSKKNLVLFNLTSILVIFTHVLGIIFVCFNYIYFIYKQKWLSELSLKKKIIYAVSLAAVLMLLLPLGLNILSQLPFAQWWGKFTYTNILFMFSDFLSPVLTNNINCPPVFFYNADFALFMTLPTLLAVVCIIFGIKQNKGFAVVSLLTVITLAVLAKTGMIVFITKYAIEILPTLIILLACGAVKLGRAGNVLVMLFIAFHLLSFFSPFYVTKIVRGEGHRIVGEILNARKPQNVIFTYYSPDRFRRYADLDGIKTYDISKTNRFAYLDNPEKILHQIPKGDTFSLVILNTVSFYTEDDLKNKDLNIPEQFATYSQIKNKLYKEIENGNYSVLHDDTYGAWTVLTVRAKPHLKRGRPQMQERQ